MRQIDGYLPTAEVAFIDEIFKVRRGGVYQGRCVFTSCDGEAASRSPFCLPQRLIRLPAAQGGPLLHPHPNSPSLFSLSHTQANSAILNALLTLLNERLFDNGSERITVPLTCLVRSPAGRLLWLGAGGQGKAGLLHSHGMNSQLAACNLFIAKRPALPVRLPQPTADCRTLESPVCCRWAPPTSCPSRRSWTRCMTASSSAATWRRCGGWEGSVGACETWGRVTAACVRSLLRM